VHVAVAWCGNPKHGQGYPYKYFAEFKGKITITIGESFNQTHEDGIRFFLDRHANVRIFRRELGLFHPKVYLFSKAGKITLFIGSSNFTASGFNKNAEINLLLEGKGNARIPILVELRSQLARWHSDEFSLIPDDKWMANYANRAAASRRAQKNATSPNAVTYEDEISSTSWLAIEEWPAYYKAVQNGTTDLTELNDFLDEVQKKLPLPWRTDYLDDLELRKMIGGYDPYGFLGNIGASGGLRKLLKNGTTKQKATMVKALNTIARLEASGRLVPPSSPA
jgi:hypothetical protein